MQVIQSSLFPSHGLQLWTVWFLSMALSYLGLQYVKSICSRLIKLCIDFVFSRGTSKRAIVLKLLLCVSRTFPLCKCDTWNYHRPLTYPNQTSAPPWLGIKPNFLPFPKIPWQEKREGILLVFRSWWFNTSSFMHHPGCLACGFSFLHPAKYLAGVLLLLISYCL